MIKIIDHNKMGKSEQGWLNSTFHFSFANYYNPDNIQFGPLRVVNDDIFHEGGGFDTHPHEDMEIVSYVINGTLTHKDSMGNKRELTRGQIQYMSAGTGITHSEFNLGKGDLRFLQIWILPEKEQAVPNYGDYNFNWDDREGKWLHMVSGEKGNGPVKIHRDMDISVLNLQANEEITYSISEGRQAYLIQIEGEGWLNSLDMTSKDGAEITNESVITLKAKKESHYIIFDMAV